MKMKSQKQVKVVFIENAKAKKARTKRRVDAVVKQLSEWMKRNKFVACMFIHPRESKKKLARNQAEKILKQEQCEDNHNGTGEYSSDWLIHQMKSQFHEYHAEMVKLNLRPLHKYFYAELPRQVHAFLIKNDENDDISSVDDSHHTSSTPNP